MHINDLRSFCSSPCLFALETKLPQDQGRRRNSVKFSLYDDVIEIPHINDLSQEEREGIWMSLDEIRSSRSKCRRMVEMMDKMPSKLKGIRVHGLDKHTSAHTARRAEIRRQVNNAVFELQAFQVTQGLDIADVMAEVCRKYSLDCVSKAHEVGVLAAEEAQSF